MTRINKSDWDNWIDSCPVSTMQNLQGVTRAIFYDRESFTKWLKNIPIFEEEKDTQCLATKKKHI